MQLAVRRLAGVEILASALMVFLLGSRRAAYDPSGRPISQ
jgi:hypothetical protein